MKASCPVPGHDEALVRPTEMAEQRGFIWPKQPESRGGRFDSVMYRHSPSPRERAATVGLVAAIHVALALALLNMSGTVRLPVPDALTQLVDVTAEPPPPPIVTIEPETEETKKKEGAASAKNIDSEATPVVAPKPVIPVPTPQPIVASPTPRQGAEATQGASDVVGPGTGAGGSGTGTGSGGAGNGDGAGGNGLAVVRARLATRPLTRRDFSPEILERWPRGRPVQMGFQIDAEGRTIQCVVYIGTGDPQLDAMVCAIAKARLRFYPGVDRNGRRVADWAGYGQRPLN